MDEDQIIIFTTGPSCGKCIATKSKFKRLGLPFEEVDVTKNTEWGDTLRAAGYTSSPVVLVPEEDIWQDLHPDDIIYLSRRLISPLTTRESVLG